MVHADVPGGESVEQVEPDEPNLSAPAMWKFCLSRLFILTCNFPRVGLINAILKKKNVRMQWWEASPKSNHCCLKQMNEQMESNP